MPLPMYRTSPCLIPIQVERHTLRQNEGDCIMEHVPKDFNFPFDSSFKPARLKAV